MSGEPSPVRVSDGEPGPIRLSCLFTVLVGLVVGAGAFLVISSLPQSAEEEDREEKWRELESRVRRDLVELLRKDRQAFQKRLNDLKEKGGRSDEVNAMYDAKWFDKEQRAAAARQVVLVAIGGAALVAVWYVAYRVLEGRMS